MKYLSRLMILPVAALFLQAVAEDVSAVLKKTRTIYSVANPGSRAAKAGGFIQNDSLWVPCPQNTTVAVSHDDKNLYICFDMKEEPENMKYLHNREKVKITYWANNCVEVMLQPPEGKQKNFWYHLAVDCAGHVFFARENDVSEMPGVVNTKEVSSSNIRTKVKLLKNGWTVSAVIPLKELNGTSFSGEWRANFGRTRIVNDKIAYYVWNRTKGYQQSGNFGVLKFGAPADIQQQENKYINALTEYQKSKAAIVAKLKARSYEWKYAYGKGEMYKPFDTVYSAEKGFGWLEKGIKSGSFDTKNTRLWDSPINALCDNYVFNDVPNSNGRVVNNFRVDLPNGKYKVSLLAGFIYEERTPGEKAPQRRRFSLSLQGKKVRNYDIGTIMYTKDAFHVDVTDGKLIMTFDGDTVFPDRPETAEWAGKGALGKYYRPGWIVNAICIYPASERKAAEKQIAADQLELWFHTPEELAKLEEIVIKDPEITLPEAIKNRGYALFARPVGDLIFAGSRPKKKELTDSLSVKAAPGETFYLPFALLPLKDIDQVDIATDSADLTLRESVAMSYPLGGGKYRMQPWYLEDYRFMDHDMNQGETRFFWLSGKIPMDAAAGIRNYTVKISGEGKSFDLPVKVEVLPFKLDETEFYYGGDFCEGYNVPRRIYDDKILNACKDVSINTSTLTLLHCERPGAYENIENNIRFLKKMNYPTKYTIYYPIPNLVKEDIPLREQKITRFSDETFNMYMEAAKWAHEKMKEDKDLRLIYYFMDEAHCKSEPYWAEQVRIAKAVRERYPDLPIMASESEGSFWRSKDYVNFPRMHDMENFNHPDLQGKLVGAYPNQLMVAEPDINGPRMITGWICSTTTIRAIYTWQLFEALQVNSGLRRSQWTLFVQSAVGGYRVLPRVTTIMGQIGIYDQYYLNTLRNRLEAAEKSDNAELKKTAEKINRKLTLILREVKPSYVYYGRNGGIWPARVFDVLRKFMIDSIIELDKYSK